MSADRELLSFVRDIEAVEDQIRDFNQSKSAIYKDAAGRGYDKKTMRKVVAARRMDPSDRQEQDDLFDLYMQAIERAEKGVAHAHVEIIEKSGSKSVVGIPATLPEHDKETGEVFEPAPPPPGAETAGDLSAPAFVAGPVSPSATVPLADTAPEPDAPPPVIGSGAPIPDELIVPHIRKDHEPTNPNCQKPATCKWARSMASCSSCAQSAMKARAAA